MFNLEEEEIDGYVVSSKMKRIWKAELELLKLLDALCKKHGLKYYVVYGTLLGTVRHKGFIPWDDDIDVFMMRDDYMRLLQIAPGEISKPYFFQSIYTDSMVWGISKIRDSRTTAIEFPDMDESFNQGLFIDIFPLDSSDDGTPGMKMVTQIKHNIWDCIYNRQAICNNLDNPDIWKLFVIDKSMVLELVNMSYQDAMRCFEDFCSSHLYDTNILRSWSSEVMGRLGKHYEREWFEEVIEMPFCDMMVPVPAGYEKLLIMDYGEDWRTPVNTGTLHNGIILDPDISYTEWFKRKREG